MWVSHASRLWECWAPARPPEPPWVRRTIGTESWPPDMKWALAAWLTSWSSASVMKSMNMISTTGRRPAWAAPTAIPHTAPSLIGRVAHALAAELLGQALGGQVGAALGDVLADHDHALVLAHRLRQGAVDRLDVGRLGHVA